MSKIPGTNILWTEYQCHHCGELPPFFYVINDDGEREVRIEYAYLFTCFEEIRNQWGSGIVVTSGYRCPGHQLSLYLKGKSSTAVSVHMFGLALDMRCKDEEEVRQMATIAKALPMKPRVGWQEYIEKPKPWIHIDLGHLITPGYSSKLRQGAEW